MEKFGIKNPKADLGELGIQTSEKVFWNLSPEELVEESIRKDLGQITNSGALSIYTGTFTGRSPKDRFIVKDDITSGTVDWSEINIAFEAEKFDQLKAKMIKYLADKELYVRDAYVCADRKYSQDIRLITEFPWSNQFGYNMFLRPTEEEILNFAPQWTIICAPEFMADPEVDGTRQKNFAVLNFTQKTILIGGTGYTGEIKKGIFSALNFILPKDENVLAMHCSANVGDDGDTAIFFGLSGTGKTTLSADPNRKLIGDDEHGWSDEGVFNFEGGCYAKVIDLEEDKEPEIFHAIKHRAILENIKYYEGTRVPNFKDTSITQNTRVSYPIYHIDNIQEGSLGGHPKNIFFLTADAFGVLPPISKLTKGQAMYYFMSGYTAKVAGTEEGVDEPEATFSACFGAPFMPLHAVEYAKLLGHKMEEHSVNIWLVNTGWTGGEFGVGHRIKLRYTRAMIIAALNGSLDNVEYTTHCVFGLKMPKVCEGVPAMTLHPLSTWGDEEAYYKKANYLAKAFNDNFKQFADMATEEILAAAPKERVDV